MDYAATPAPDEAGVCRLQSVGCSLLSLLIDYGLRGQPLAGLSLRASQGCSGNSRVSFV